MGGGDSFFPLFAKAVWAEEKSSDMHTPRSSVLLPHHTSVPWMVSRGTLWVSSSEFDNNLFYFYPHRGRDCWLYTTGPYHWKKVDAVDWYSTRSWVGRVKKSGLNTHSCGAPCAQCDGLRGDVDDLHILWFPCKKSEGSWRGGRMIMMFCKTSCLKQSL